MEDVGVGDEQVAGGMSSSSSASASASSSSSNIMNSGSGSRLPLLALNHVSYLCKSVPKSVKFYEDVLGFVLIKRPSSFDFEGAWLFNYGIGIHLLQSEKVPVSQGKINPKDNHISFQCSDMDLVMKKLREWNVEYVTAVVQEGGIKVDQLFFHDPDGYMVEICNCQNLPVLPLSSCPLKLPNTPGNLAPPPSFYGKQSLETLCYGKDAAMMMENFMADMMAIAI